MRWHSFSLVRRSEGSSPQIRREHRATTLHSVRDLPATMMQPCASAAKLRAAGPNCTAVQSPLDRAGHRYLGSSSAVRHIQQTEAEIFAYLLIMLVMPLRGESRHVELRQS